MGGEKALLSSPAPPVWEAPSHLPLPISLVSLLCPQDPHGLDGALECRALAWELSRLCGPSGQGNCLLLLFHSSQSPSHLPLLISLASGAPILSGLHFSSPLSPPMSYRFTLGFLPSPWAPESCTSSQQVCQLWGDANSASSHTAILTPPPQLPFLTV